MTEQAATGNPALNARGGRSQPIQTGPTAPSKHALGTGQAAAIVFVASACTMIIEILAGRLMAPYLGVSLYTWTSIIGVVLAGMTLGNFVGGWVADTRASRVILSRSFLTAAATCVVLVTISGTVFGRVADLSLPVVVRIVLAATVIFFIPSFLLGTTTPQVVKLTLRSLDDAGRTVGSIYAMSAFGSIVGTFLAGFVLADYVGTIRTIWLVTGVLFVCGILIREGFRRSSAALAALLLFGNVGASATAVFDGPCDQETGYFCIRTTEHTEPDGTVATRLVLDRLVHTSLRPDDPTFLGYGYEEVYRQLTEPHLEAGTPGPLLVVGGGGYAFPRYMEAVQPEVPVEVVEIDPGVVAFNHDRLGLSHDTAIVTHTGDARTFFREDAPAATYSVVQIDVFNDFGVPYHLTTVEFLESVRASMAPDGLVMTNLIDAPDSGQFVQAYANTIQEVFPVVTIYAVEKEEPRSTYVVVGSSGPVTQVVPGWSRLTIEQFAATCPEQTDLVLTDDFAPTDRLLRPVMERTGDK